MSMLRKNIFKPKITHKEKIKLVRSYFNSVNEKFEHILIPDLVILIFTFLVERKIEKFDIFLPTKISTYVNGVKHGIEHMYNNFGHVRRSSNYINGVIKGEQKFYNIDGTLSKIINYP